MSLYTAVLPMMQWVLLIFVFVLVMMQVLMLMIMLSWVGIIARSLILLFIGQLVSIIETMHVPSIGHD
jgi:hypothetical protein